MEPGASTASEALAERPKRKRTRRREPAESDAERATTTRRTRRSARSSAVPAAGKLLTPSQASEVLEDTASTGIASTQRMPVSREPDANTTPGGAIQGDSVPDGYVPASTRRPPWAPLVVGVILAGALPVLGALMVPGATRTIAPPSIDSGQAASSVPQPGGSVAAATSSAPPTEAVIVETFDGLSINSPLPPPWEVTGSGAAVVIALPTSVDRSVRLRTSSGGDPERACHPLRTNGGSDMRVALDILLETPVGAASDLITLRSGSTDALVIGVDAGGRIVGDDASQAPAGALAPGTWAHVSISVHPDSKTVDWDVSAADGTTLASATGRPLDPASAGGIESFCVVSPGGTPGGSIAVNNVRAAG
jgi:hypothetical protein